MGWKSTRSTTHRSGVSCGLVPSANQYLIRMRLDKYTRLHMTLVGSSLSLRTGKEVEVMEWMGDGGQPPGRVTGGVSSEFEIYRHQPAPVQKTTISRQGPGLERSLRCRSVQADQANGEPTSTDVAALVPCFATSQVLMKQHKPKSHSPRKVSSTVLLGLR